MTTAARALIDSSLVWDHHGCMPLRPHDASFLPQLQRHAAGFDGVMISLGFGQMGVEAHLRNLATFRH